MATRYKNKEIAHFSTNKGISDISVCREANPIVSSVKEKSIDQEDFPASKYLSTNKAIISIPVVSSLGGEDSGRVNFLARKQASIPTMGTELKDKLNGTSGQIIKEK